MSLPFIIQPAGWRDLAAVQKIEKECFKDDAWPMWDVIGVLSLPGVTRFKALVGDQVVGFLAGEVKLGDRAGWITTLGVLSLYRRHGIAAALLQAGESHLGRQVIRLCVRISNLPARLLYEHHGYRQVDVYERYYLDGEDAYLMEKRIPSETRAAKND